MYTILYFEIIILHGKMFHLNPHYDRGSRIKQTNLLYESPGHTHCCGSGSENGAGVRKKQEYGPSLIALLIRNWPDTRFAVIMTLGPRPAKSPRTPASRDRTMRRWAIEPVGPCPLIIWLKSVSAGCMYYVSLFGFKMFSRLLEYLLSAPANPMPYADPNSSWGNSSAFSDADANSSWRSPKISFCKVDFPPTRSLIVFERYFVDLFLQLLRNDNTKDLDSFDRNIFNAYGCNGRSGGWYMHGGGRDGSGRVCSVASAASDSSSNW